MTSNMSNAMATYIVAVGTTCYTLTQLIMGVLEQKHMHHINDGSKHETPRSDTMLCTLKPGTMSW